MRKQWWCGVMGAIFLFAQPAWAEHKLLVTDVLDRGQAEVLADYRFSNGKVNNKDGLGRSLTVKMNAQAASVAAGVGLGYGLELSFELPYLVFHKAHVRGFDDYKIDGFKDLTAGVKYNLLQGEASHFKAVLGLDVKFDTASDAPDKAGTGTTDLSPYIAFSSLVSEGNVLYLKYRPTFVDHGGADDHELTLGIESIVNETFTVDAALSASYVTSEGNTDSYQIYGAELACYIQMVPDFYLLPHATIAQATNFDGEDLRVKPDWFYSAGLGLYYLY